MRMWMVDPKLMCRQHLLGSHVELHMIVGAINKGKSIDGFIKNALIEPQSVREYHQRVVKEMLNRGYNHKSPLPDFEYTEELFGMVDSVMNLEELAKRCPACAERIKNESN